MQRRGEVQPSRPADRCNQPTATQTGTNVDRRAGNCSNCVCFALREGSAPRAVGPNAAEALGSALRRAHPPGPLARRCCTESEVSKQRNEWAIRRWEGRQTGCKATSALRAPPQRCCEYLAASALALDSSICSSILRRCCASGRPISTVTDRPACLHTVTTCHRLIDRLHFLPTAAVAPDRVAVGDTTAIVTSEQSRGSLARAQARTRTHTHTGRRAQAARPRRRSDGHSALNSTATVLCVQFATVAYEQFSLRASLFSAFRL